MLVVSLVRIAGHSSDEIDRVLAAHYGFTDKQLDFIPSTKLRTGINYDIKYRMGRGVKNEEQ